MLGVAQTRSTATIIKTTFVQTQRMQNGPKKTVQTIANCAHRAPPVARMDNPTPVILTHSRPMTPAKTRSNAMNMAMTYARLTDHGPTKTVHGIANFVNHAVTYYPIVLITGRVPVLETMRNGPKKTVNRTVTTATL